MTRSHHTKAIAVAGVVVLLAIWPLDRPAAQPDISPMADPTSAPEIEVPAAGGYLSLRQALEIALRTHPVLREGEAGLKAATARSEQTRSLYYPQISANFDTVSGVGRVNPRFVAPAGAMLQPNLSQYAGGVTASQRLFDFGFTQNMLESSQKAARAQEEDVNGRTALVILNVQRTYYNSLKRRRLVQIAEETVRERGTIKFQIEQLYRKQLKSKLDVDLVQVELTNAQSQLVRARNDLKSSFADLNRAMGIKGPEDYVLEDLPVDVRALRNMESLISESLSHPELRKARELVASAESKLKATKRQYLPTVSAFASAGDFRAFDSSRNVNEGGWWSASGMISMPLFTGFLIENQVREASAQQVAAEATSMSIEQALIQQVTNSYLDTVTLAQQIKLAEEQVTTAMEALRLAKQRYKLGLGSVIEVTQSEVALTAAQTRLADTQYEYKIAEVTLAYAAGLTTVSESHALYR
jgi:outer membrane protein